MITITAVSLYQVVLSVHIAAVVVGFGVTFAYPIVFGYGLRLDPRHTGWFHRVQNRIGKTLITPGLTVILITGIYLASHLHQWSTFYVGWGMMVALLLGGLSGVYFSPRESRLAEIAERDVAAAGDGPVTLSAEYHALNRQVGTVAMLGSLLVLITVFLMTVQA
jgi:hypothetical protein